MKTYTNEKMIIIAVAAAIHDIFVSVTSSPK
jgi:hypothetical protein